MPQATANSCGLVISWHDASERIQSMYARIASEFLVILRVFLKAGLTSR